MSAPTATVATTAVKPLNAAVIMKLVRAANLWHRQTQALISDGHDPQPSIDALTDVLERLAAEVAGPSMRRTAVEDGDT